MRTSPARCSFVRRCADMLHEEARRSGARIVNSCGFDSVPPTSRSSLTATAALEAHDGGLTDATLYVRKAPGGLQRRHRRLGRQQAIAMAEDPWAKKVLTDPYALSADRDHEPRRRTRSGSGSGSGAASGSSVGAVLGALTRSAKVARSMVLVSRDASDGHWYGPSSWPLQHPAGPPQQLPSPDGRTAATSHREVLDLGSPHRSVDRHRHGRGDGRRLHRDGQRPCGPSSTDGCPPRRGPVRADPAQRTLPRRAPCVDGHRSEVPHGRRCSPRPGI